MRKIYYIGFILAFIIIISIGGYNISQIGMVDEKEFIDCYTYADWMIAVGSDHKGAVYDKYIDMTQEAADNFTWEQKEAGILTFYGASKPEHANLMQRYLIQNGYLLGENGCTLVPAPL